MRSVPLLGTAVQQSFDISNKLKQVLEANPHLQNAFSSSVAKAVEFSLSHQDTKPRTPTQQILNERMSISMQAIEIMYFDEKMSLTQSLDILPQVLVDTIKMGFDAAKSPHEAGAWAPHEQEYEFASIEGDMNEEDDDE